VPTVLLEPGGWKSESMVRRYAHMSVEHLLPYTDQLLPAPASECPGRRKSLRHKEKEWWTH